MTRQIHVGGIPIGGGAPVTIQSMTNTRTDDLESTLSQIRSLAAAGCQIVRVAVPDRAAARAVAKIKEASPLPVVVDIHFDYKLALEAIAAGADKVRINPGNIGGEDRVKAVADACRLRGIPIRIGVNGGSLEKGLLAKYGGVCPEAMVESAFGHIRLLNKFDFDDICVSLKSSSVPMTMRAYQLMREKSNYPLHIGVTEAGTVRMGTLKSAVGIGGLLALGIGDTIRVSLSADPVEEVYAARDILKAAGVRREGAELVSCPTCGRTRIDLIGLAAQVEERLKAVEGTPLKIFNANAQSWYDSYCHGSAGYNGVMANFHPDLYKWAYDHKDSDPEKAQLVAHFLTTAAMIEMRAYPVSAKYHQNLVDVPMSLVTRSADAAKLDKNARGEVESLIAMENYVRKQLGIL